MNKIFLKIAFVLVFFISAVNVLAAEEKENFFLKRLNHRVYMGFYSSYFEDNIRMAQAGYDCVLKLMPVWPNFNLMDFSLGLNALMAFDQFKEPHKDNFGNIRPDDTRITPGLELNWNIRLYVIPVPPVGGRIFLEGLGITLIVYARDFPDTGTAKGSRLNIGSHLGIGMEYAINDYRAFTALRWFHSSNGKAYEDNPALNAIGILMGVQFK
jgi:hypothetical protein